MEIGCVGCQIQLDLGWGCRERSKITELLERVKQRSDLKSRNKRKEVQGHHWQGKQSKLYSWAGDFSSSILMSRNIPLSDYGTDTSQI